MQLLSIYVHLLGKRRMQWPPVDSIKSLAYTVVFDIMACGGSEMHSTKNFLIARR